MILYACGSDIIVDYLEVCEKNYVKIDAIIDNGFASQYVQSVKVKEYDFQKGSLFLVPLFSPFNRYQAVTEALALGLTPYPILSDNNNDLPTVFKHGVGCFLNKGVIIGSHSELGNYVVINRGACLGHHAKIADFASIGPGVLTGGGINIGRGAMIGTGAVILPNVKIGEFAVVGAGAVIPRDIPSHAVVIGNSYKQVISVTEYVF